MSLDDGPEICARRPQPPRGPLANSPGGAGGRRAASGLARETKRTKLIAARPHLMMAIQIDEAARDIDHRASAQQVRADRTARFCFWPDGLGRSRAAGPASTQAPRGFVALDG